MEIGEQGRRRAARITRDLALILFGASATMLLLNWRNLLSMGWASDVTDALMFAFFILTMASTMLEPKHDLDDREPSPRVIGIIVVVATGLTGAVALYWSGQAIAGSIVLIVTWVAMLFVWRFATRRADEIGEARFRGE